VDTGAWKAGTYPIVLTAGRRGAFHQRDDLNLVVARITRAQVFVPIRADRRPQQRASSSPSTCRPPTSMASGGVTAIMLRPAATFDPSTEAVRLFPTFNPQSGNSRRGRLTGVQNRKVRPPREISPSRPAGRSAAGDGIVGTTISSRQGGQLRAWRDLAEAGAVLTYSGRDRPDGVSLDPNTRRVTWDARPRAGGTLTSRVPGERWPSWTTSDTIVMRVLGRLPRRMCGSSHPDFASVPGPAPHHSSSGAASLSDIVSLTLYENGRSWGRWNAQARRRSGRNATR